MTVETLIAAYGYWAVLIGTFFEGETIVLAAGFAAHRGYLDLAGVILAAFAGTLAGDQLFFHLGRRHSAFVLARLPSWQARRDRIDRLLARYQTLLVLAFRFMYGLRTVTPFVLGMGRMPAGRFLMWNTISAALWAVTVTCLGYQAGNALALLVGDLKRIEGPLLAAVLGLGVAVWAIRATWQHRAASRKRHGTGPT